MKIILDERESMLYSGTLALLENEKTPFPSIQLSKEVLPLGDILLKTDDDVLLLIIERKSISDLLASIKDGRYEEQSFRLLNSAEKHSIVYIIEGMFTYNTDKKTVISAMTSLQFFKGFSVIRTCSILETAEYIIHMADKIERNMKKGKIFAYSSNSDITENQDGGTVPSYSTVVKKVKKDKKAPSEKKRVKEIDTFKKTQLEKIAKKHDISLKGRDGKVKTKEQLFKSLKRKNLV